MDISVVIPAYNAEKFIRRSLDSVLSQVYSPLEIIVVNDGSLDNTASVVKEYESVLLVNQENTGVSGARNSGIRRAQGRWIAFLDADDEWEPEHLQNAANELRKYPDCGWYSDGHQIKGNDTGTLIKRCLPRTELTTSLIEDYFAAIPPIAYFGPSTIVVKKSCFEAVGLFDEKFKTGEDRDMWIRLALRYPEVAYHKSIGSTLWARDDSLSRGTSKNFSETTAKYEYWESLAKRENALERFKPRLSCWVIGSCKRCIKDREFRSAFNMFLRFHYLFPAWVSVIGKFVNKLASK